MSESALSILATHGKACNPIVTLDECLQYQASSQPQKEAYIFHNGDGARTSITFAELHTKCKEVGNVMKHLGVKTRDVVIVALQNGIEFLIAQFGLLLIGAIPLTCGIGTKDCSDLIELVNQANAVAIIIPTINKAGRNNDHNQLIEKVGISTLRFVISSDAETDSFGCLSLKHLMKSIPTHDISYESTDIDEIAVIMPTSGTTGSKKLVCHSFRNIYSMLKFDTTSVLPKSLLPQRLFCPARFAWLGGSPLKEVFNGTTRVTITGDRWKTDVQNMLLIAEKESCNILELTPNFLSEIISRNIPIPKCVMGILTGGAPIPKNFQKLLEYVDYLVVGYGLLETGGISGTYFTKNTTVEANIGGIPRAGVKIKIVNDNNEIVRRGVTGRILVKTPFSSLSYLGDARRSNDHWVNTEDIGYISENGELFVLGRSAYCILIGDSKGYACEFEQRVLSCRIEGVSEVAVVPVPDKITNQQACACVIKTPNTELSERSFLQLVNENLFGPKIPKYILFVDSYPRNQNGKVDREKLRELATERLHLSG